MHIAEGTLSGSTGLLILGAGWAATAVGTAIGLRRMDYQRVPQVALLSATFFVVSLIQIPIGPTSVHLVLCGLMGLVLGWAAFPALLVALTLQVLLAGVGGPTTLGINTFVMAAPAVTTFLLLRRAVQTKSEMLTFVAAFFGGASAFLFGSLLNAAALALAGTEYHLFAGTALTTHLVAMPLEGLVTATTVVFLRKVRPELLESPWLAAHG